MAIDTIINRIGFVITICSAFFSWWQASRAKKIKDEIKDDRIKIALLDLIAKADFSRNEAQKLTPLTSGKQARGFNLVDSLKTIQQFIERFNDTKHLFTNGNLGKCFDELKKIFDEYKSEPDNTKKGIIGKTLYDSMNSILAELHKYFDDMSSINK